MRNSCALGLLLVVVVACPGMAEQIVLSPVDEAQLEQTASNQPCTLTDPSYGILSDRYSTTGMFREAFFEYSLASLPNNATVTSASFTYKVILISNSADAYPSVSLDLYDGGDGQVLMGDIYKNGFNVAQSQDFTDTGIYTTNFFSVIPLNDRATDFSSGYLGMRLFPRVDLLQTEIMSAKFATRYGYQAPVLTITYTVPEPASLFLLGTAGAMLLLYGRRRKTKTVA